MRKLAIAALVCLTLPAQASFFLNPYYSSSDTNLRMVRMLRLPFTV